MTALPEGVAERTVELTVDAFGSSQTGYAVADDLIMSASEAPPSFYDASIRPSNRDTWLDAKLAASNDRVFWLRTAESHWAGMPAEPGAAAAPLAGPCLVVYAERDGWAATHGVLRAGGPDGYVVESWTGPDLPPSRLTGAPVLTEDGRSLLGLVVPWPDGDPVHEGQLTAIPYTADLAEFLHPMAAAEPVPVNDQVEWLSDAPTTRDVLRRNALACAIAERLSRRADGEPGTFLMLLDGRWGSGKTSVLRMTQRQLESDGWTIVHYDAWRQSRIGASWWTLLGEIRQAVFATKSRPRRTLLRLQELWRLRLTRTPAVLALCLVFAAALGLFLLLRPERFDLSSLGTALQSVAAVVTAVGTLWAGAVVSARFLLWRSRRSARFFEETAENPLRQVAEHIGWLIHRLSRPLLVAIDDIDRCPGEQVVELLESVQTLLRDAPAPGRGAQRRPVAVIVAADAAWLHRAFEQHYEGFGPAVAAPGKPLGYLFCDKIFQLVVTMPGMGEVSQTAFLASLLGGRGGLPSATGDHDRRVRDTARAIESSGSEAEVLAVLSSVEQPVREEVAAQAVRVLTRRDVVQLTEHTLTRFAPLLPPNPRSMKRFVNDYSMARAVRTLEGDPVPVDALAQWTIVRTRWPALATCLAEHPDAAADQAPPDTVPDRDLADLLASPDVRRVLSFPAGTALTPDLIRRCHGGHVHSHPPLGGAGRDLASG